MFVTIKDNTASILSGTTIKANIFLRSMADEIINISTPRTPMKTGRLRMDVNKAILGLSGKVKWGKNYAIFQETKQFRNYTTPGTGPHFAEDAVNEAVKRTDSVARRVGLL